MSPVSKQARLSCAMLLFWMAILTVAVADMQAATPIRIIGDDSPDKRFLHEVDRLKNSAKSFDSLASKLQELLSTYGYLDGSIEQAGDTIVILPKTRYTIGSVKLNLIPFVGEPTTQIIPKIKQPATKYNISELRESILRKYQDDGFYFASIVADSISFDNLAIDIAFKLITGPEVLLERVRFKGLKKTRVEFVRQLSGLEIGQSVGDDALKKAVEKIETVEWLRHDSLPRIIPNRNYDRAEVLFLLRELRTSSLELAGGYLPSDEVNDGELVGKVNFRGNNLFGQGRRFELLYDKKDRKSSRTELGLNWPFFIPDHIELNLNLRQLDYDSSYTEFGISAGVGLYSYGGSFFAVGVGWIKTEPQNSSQAPSRRLSGFLKTITDSRDDRFNPFSGGRFYSEISYVRRLAWPLETGLIEISNESKFDLGFDYYLPLAGDWTTRLNFQASALLTSRDLIDLSEKYKLGGFGSLRGYRQDQFAGRRLALVQSEVRWRPNSRTAFYLFYDFGMIYSRKLLIPDEAGSETLKKSGYGYGLYVGGEKARMTLETGWGEGDRLSEGKIHFGLTALF